jgi:hypothetical protein
MASRTLTLMQSLGYKAPAGPWFGLDANIAPAPWSAVLSVAMILGVARLGNWLISRLNLPTVNQSSLWQYVAPIVGAGFLMAVCYPLALLGVFPREIERWVAWPLVMMGIWQGLTWLSQFRRGNLSPSRWAMIGWELRSVRGSSVVIAVLVGGLGMLALAPITDADSLAYHVSVAIGVLNTGAFPTAPEWFQGRLAGAGEVLIGVGLSIGAEQFGSLLQFLGLVGIIGVVRHGGWTDKNHQMLALLALLSCPVLIPHVASPKPFLLPIAMTTTALYLAITFLNRRDQPAKGDRRIQIYILVCLLVMTASTNKLNFLLSGGLVGLMAFGIMWRQGLGWAATGWGLAAFGLIMLPPALWKNAHYGGALWEAIVTPFPGEWPGRQAFLDYLLAYRDSSWPFPMSLMVPEGLGTLTTVLGLASLLFILLPCAIRESGPSRIFASMALVLALVASFLGQKTSRFYLEPLTWVLLALLAWATNQKRQLPGWVRILVYGQVLASAVIIITGIATLSVGAVSNRLRHDVMMRHASGYQAMNWVDQVAPEDARIISSIRSIGLLPRYPISYDWDTYVKGDTERGTYEALVARQCPNYFLVETEVGQRPSLLDQGLRVSAGPATVYKATRNPFNSGSKSQAWLLRLDQPPCENMKRSKGADL